MRTSFIILAVLFALNCGKPPKGEQGPAGEAGAVGERGLDGRSVEGPPGKDAELETIELCPSTTSSIGFKEYVLKIQGELYAVYASGQKIFMTKLKPGNYVTTDGRNCQFTVNAQGEVN